MKVLVVDIGNTSTSLALATHGVISRVARLDGKKASIRIIRQAVAGIVRNETMAGAIVASVVPSVNKKWTTALKASVGGHLLFVHHRLKMDVKISYPRPETIGADRLADACGAVARYGAPVIVADFGTALTFDVVSPGREYRGGVITPGLPFMTDYLAEKTALLPRITLQGAHEKIGRSTAAAMRIGARIGYRGMTREITRHLQSCRGMQKAVLCATGGYARWVLSGSDMPYHFAPDLTLFGLSRIFQLNV